jgi:hypothetical protein
MKDAGNHRHGAHFAAAARAWVACAFLLAAGVSMLSIAPAGAVTLFQKSAYTTIDLTTCTTLRQDAGGNAYLCQGLDGTSVYYGEGDRRTFLAAGPDADKSMAATQTLKAFNSPLRKSGRATIEWRFTIKDQRRVPYAMIVRYFTRSDEGRGEVLVVTRLAGGQACHVAYIDALANEDAIVLARRIADEKARTFKCGEPASVEGARGRSPM